MQKKKATPGEKETKARVLAMARKYGVEDQAKKIMLKYDDAVKYDQIEFDKAIDQRLGVMDVAAMILCHDNALDLIVCNINQSGALLKLAGGELVGTRVFRKEV